MCGTELLARKIIALCLTLAACGATAKQDSPGEPLDPSDAAVIADTSLAEAVAFDCEVIAPTSCPDPPLHFPDVQPIIHQRCAAVCHSGTVDGTWPLTTYTHVADWWDVVRDEVLTCAMPPPDAGVPITSEERLAILTWLRCGFPL